MGWLDVVFALLIILEGVHYFDATVVVRDTDITTKGKTFRVICTVKDEEYLGWYAIKSNGKEKERKITGTNFFVDKFYTENRGDRYTLIIQDVTVSDGGNYTCKGSKNQKRFHLYVEFYVLQFPKTQRLDVGQTTVIHCAAVGYPTPHFIWYKDWNPKVLGHNNDRFKLLPNGSLLVSNVQDTDTGNYSCRIIQLDEKSRTREERKDIKVFVYGPPRIDLTKSSSVVYSYKGNPRKIILTCRFWGFPVPKMIITKGNRVLKKENVELRNRVISGNIRARKDSDFGSYICKASNELGNKTHTVHLRQAGGPNSPVNVTSIVHCGYITVTWDPPLFDGGLPITMYGVELVRGSQVIDSAAVRNQKGRFTFSGGLILPNTRYALRIMAENEASKGTWRVINITSDICPPHGKITITNKQTVINTTSFTLTWSGPPDNGGDPDLEYVIEYSKKSDDGKYVHWMTRKKIRGRQYNVTGLKRGETYKFRVIGVNRMGQSEAGEKVFEITTEAVTYAPPTLIKPDPDVIYDIKVNCSSLLIQVDMALKDFPYLDRESFSLKDTSCVPYKMTHTRVIMRTRLDGCGTTNKHRDMSVTYYNSVSARVVRFKTNVHIVEFPFSCTFYKKRTIGVPSFQPRKRITVVEEGFGNFSFEMDLYHTSKYKSPYDVSDYPVQVNPTADKLYAQTKLLASDKNLVALAYQCVATPSINPNDDLQYFFIDKGCAIDDTVVYNSSAAPVQRFEMAPFKFRKNADAIIYLHCRILVCHKDDVQSRCMKGCIPHKRSRTKRGAEVLRRSVFQSVTLGPVNVKERRFKEEQPITSHPSGSVSSVLLIVFGTLIGSALLFAALLFVLRRVVITSTSGSGSHVKVSTEGDEMQLHETIPL